MARISALLEAGPTLSFEFSAPRDPDGAARLRRVLRRLARHQPSFMSVTYGAGGTTRGPTRDWVAHIRDDLGVTGFIMEPNVGGTVPAERVQNSIRLYAEEVGPALRE